VDTAPLVLVSGFQWLVHLLRSLVCYFPTSVCHLVFAFRVVRALWVTVGDFLPRFLCWNFQRTFVTSTSFTLLITRTHTMSSAPLSAPPPAYSPSNFVVHKFGGTSVGSVEAILKVVEIVEDVIGPCAPPSAGSSTSASPEDVSLDLHSGNTPRIAVVVSAMGGKPKVTDMLLDLVSLAAKGRVAEYTDLLDRIEIKHTNTIQVCEQCNALSLPLKPSQRFFRTPPTSRLYSRSRCGKRFAGTSRKTSMVYETCCGPSW
jgi:hypothetical protein